MPGASKDTVTNGERSSGAKGSLAVHSQSRTVTKGLLVVEAGLAVAGRALALWAVGVPRPLRPRPSLPDRRTSRGRDVLKSC